MFGVLSEAGQGHVENKYVPPQRRADGMNVDIRTQYAPPRFGENENLFCWVVYMKCKSWYLTELAIIVQALVIHA